MIVIIRRDVIFITYINCFCVQFINTLNVNFKLKKFFSVNLGLKISNMPNFLQVPYSYKNLLVQFYGY